MEVDERLRWLEARISSSLHPRGDELRSLFADDQSRSAILAFCNHSESRKLYVYQSSERQEFSREEGVGPIIASAMPPKSLSEKALIFLKCTNASKLNRENMGGEVIYSECPRLALYHLELVLREVYLPMLLSLEQVPANLSSDKLIDLVQRVVSSMQVASGQREGRVLLPLPSVEVLAGAAGGVGRSTLVHIMETCVVAWMKQVKVVLHFDPNWTIFKTRGLYAGALDEYEFWCKRLASLEAVRSQLNTAVVLNVLRSLDRVQSTYAHAFVHVHRDIGKAIADCEHCLSYLRTLQPWLHKLDQLQVPEALVRVFPPLMTTLLLVWQHSGVYCYQAHFQRFLRLLSNNVMMKATTIIGVSVLEEPMVSLTNLKMALRICAAFRGCYLDFREKAIAVVKKQKEEKESQSSGESKGMGSTQGDLSSFRHLDRLGGAGDGGGQAGGRRGGGRRKGKGEEKGGKGEGKAPDSQREFLYCSWPPRNSPVFSSINGIMERCNDLLELVQTLLDFQELKPLEIGLESFLHYKGDYVLADVYMNFKECMTDFQQQAAKDLLNIESDSFFEEHFYKFRVKVRDLEQRLVEPLKRAYDGAHSLPALLHVLELYQGISRREYIKTSLQPQLALVVARLQAEISSVNDIVTANKAHFPPLPLRPPVSSRLLWLHALRDRVEEPMGKIKKVAPELLEGDEGWKLRQSHGDLIKLLEMEISEAETGWVQSVPAGLHKNLRDNILRRDVQSDIILVNLDPVLNETLAEVHYLTAPPMSLRLPTQLRQLVKTVDYSYLQKKQTCLAVIVQVYNELQGCVSDIDQTLLQHKLHQVEKMIELGLEQLDWLSTAFFDFTAKLNSAVCVDLRSTLDQVHNHIYSICDYTDAWNAQEGLDIFDSDQPQDLNKLNKKHYQLIETVSITLPSTMDRIAKRIAHTFQCIHEASQESPAWISYLRQVDDLVMSSLRIMTLKFITTLSKRTSTYEQGGSIPPLVMVELGLYGSGVRFFPPLSTQSAHTSIPEMIQMWMSNYLALARLVPKLSASHSQEKHFELAHRDSDIKNAMNKICAHVETNCRQCQSLKKRFTIYLFMWEQDVNATFADFLRGRATPHPRRFTRPETVRSRASARAHSSTSRPKSSTPSLPVLPALEPSMSTVTGVTDWEFLRPEAVSMGREEEPAHKVTLDDFDGEIAVFQGILERLKNIEDFNNVGWVCVDQHPIKDTLSSLANKWKHVYASHLERQINFVLSNLESFFDEIEPQVDLISGEESDTSAFMKIMSIFIKVNVQQVEMDNKFGAVTRAVVILDRFGHPLPPDLRKKFNQAPQRWSNLKKRVALCKQRIGPRIQAQQELIAEDITRFGEIFLNLRSNFNSSSCHKNTNSRGKALQMLTDFSRELKSLQSQAEDLIELQELLQASIFNFSLLKEFEDELGALRELWNMSELILGQHSLWSKCCWSEIDSSDLLIGTEKQLDILNGLPSKLTQSWDIYQFLTKTVYTIQNTVPVLDGLKSPAMRPRHWKQVLRYASNGSSHYLMRGSTFDPLLLEQLSFGHLMEMELHMHHKEVLMVVERAKKDVAIESLLNMFEEVWLSRQLELKEYKRVVDSAQQEALSELALDTKRSTSSTSRPGSTPGRVTSAVRSSKGVVYAPLVSSTTPVGDKSGGSSSIPLLSNTRGIFITLESHQTSLHSLVGVASATSFDDELSKWHKQLQTIEAVMVTWLKVQQLWVQLEEVYSSVDVQQHLAQEAFTFSNVDREFRELMAQAKKNPAVLSICLKDDLLLLLEKLSSSLFQCQAALVRYMEGRRSKCPWFYLLPLEDILQLTCYSSSLQQFSTSLSSVIHHIGSVEFVGGGSSHLFKEGQTSHVAITAVSARNNEQLELNQEIPCEGPVELIISKLFASISSTLRSQLYNLVSHSINPSSPSTSGMSSLHAYWAGKMSTQSILLATLLVQDISLANALQEASSNSSSQPLDTLDKAIQNSLKVLSNLMQGKPANGSVPGSKSASSFGSSVPLESSDSQASVGRNQTGESESNLQRKWNRNQLYTNAMFGRLQQLAVVLYSFRNRVAYYRALMKENPGQDVTTTINWASVPHFRWQSADQKLSLSSLDSALAVSSGSYFSAGDIVVLDQLTETYLQQILLLLKDGHNVLLTGTMGVGKRSLASHISQLAGRSLITLQCSSQVTHTTIFNHIRGMATTGCWLYWHSMDKLHPDVLQTACSLLNLLYQARQSGSSSFQWIDETVEVFPDNPGACLASISTPLEFVDYAPTPVLSSSVANSFKICSVRSQDFSEAVKLMFAIRNYSNAVSLSQSLIMFCRAYREVFDNALTDSHKPGITFDYQWFNMIASLSQQHVQELYSFAPVDSSDSDPLLAVGAQGLHVPSLVYSEISEVTRISLREKYGDAEEEAELKSHQIKCLEELSVVLALKDSILSSRLAEGKDYSATIMLIGEMFPSCDVEGLLVHEASVREGMAYTSKQDRGAGESARESRAASVVQNVQDQGVSYYAGFSKEHYIVHSCHLLQFVPTSSFQAAVSEIMSLVPVSRMLAVCGPSGCGKTAAIHVAAEALRQSSQNCFVGISTIAVEVLREDQLLGYQDNQQELWQEGVLPRCLSSMLSNSPSGKGPRVGSLPSPSLMATASSYAWIVLEGDLSQEQMDALASCCQDGTLILSNGHTINLDSSTTFIFEVSDCSNWTPSFSSKVSKVVLSQSTISWRDTVFKWLSSLSEHLKPAVWDILEPLFEKYLPATLQFISPALSDYPVREGHSTSSSSSTVGRVDPIIVPQELKLSALHVVNSCCQILESILPLPSVDHPNYSLDVEWSLVYAIIWGCGGFLTPSNKITFDLWWQATFLSGAVKFRTPKGGSLWDNYYKPGSFVCSTWDYNVSNFSLPKDKTKPFFVPTIKSMALAHLMNSLINKNIPVLLNGASGSGKTSAVKYVLSKHAQSSDAGVLHIHCDQLTESHDIWNQIWDELEWDWGKKYKPKDAKKLICFVDDIQNSGSSSTSELLREHLSTGFVCDSSAGKWYQATGVHYVVTSDHASKSCNNLTPQVLKHFVVLNWDGYSQAELVSILEAILLSHFKSAPQCTISSSSCGLTPRFFSAELCHNLAAASVQVYFKLCSMFLDIPERFHYSFALKQLIGIIRHLCDKFPTSSTVEVQDILLEWQLVSWWKWAGQMSSEVDRDRYWEILRHALKKFLDQDALLPVVLSQNSTSLNQETVDQLRAKLKSELMEYNYNMGHPTLHLNLYDGTVEEIHFLCRSIQSPPDLGHVLLLNSPYQEPKVRLAALHCNFTVTSTTTVSTSSTALNDTSPADDVFSLTQFKSDLVSIYSTAGLKNEKIILLLTEKDIFHESFFSPIYKLVKDCAITTLFSKEEQAKIVNGIRGDLTHSGLAFTKESAWQFFLNRVKNNVRVVVSLSGLGQIMTTGVYKWKNLLNSIATYSELPWDRKKLIQVASYHLKECTYLASGQMESLAHLLASIHLHLSSITKITTSNTQYQYYVERMVYKLNGYHELGQLESSRLTLALNCLSSAMERASKLQDRIQHEKIVLGEKSEACVKLLTLIGQDTAISRQHSRLVVKQKERISHLKKVLPDFEHAYEQSLQEKDDLIARSRQLVMEMHQEGLSELRSLQRPPSDIEELLVAVITILKGTSADTSWTKGAKRIMANLDRFRELLLEFSAHEDNSDALLEALDPINAKPTFTEESFAQHELFGLAASQLCVWVQGVIGLHSTLQTKVRPLQARAQSMKSSLADFSDKLKKEEGKVAILEERLRGLSVALEGASVEKSKQNDFLNKMKKELSETEDFIQSLSGLQETWERRLNESKNTVQLSAGVLCLMVALSSYLASTHHHIQMELINVDLIPLLKERGMELLWGSRNSFLSNMPSLNKFHGEENKQIEAGSTSESNLQHNEEELQDSGPLGSSHSEDHSPAVEEHMAKSFACLSECLLCYMIPEALVDEWLSLPVVFHSPCFLLFAGLIHNSWNNWPLLYDPQGYASNWIKCYKEGIVLIDARDGSYESLEHAMVHGESVLVTHFSSPVDPLLLPVIELAHTWHSTKDTTRVILFGGHRLYVHDNFRLYLSTMTPPSSLPSTLTSDLNVIHLDFSIALGQDILLDAACRTLLPETSEHFMALCKDVASTKSELRELDKNLFQSLPKDGKTDNYWHSTEKIKDIMGKKNKLNLELGSLMQDLRDCSTTMSSLLPIAIHGSLSFDIAQKIAVNKVFCTLSWDHFMEIFTKTLSDFTEGDNGSKHGKSFWKNMTKKDRDMVQNEIIRKLNCGLIQEAFRTHDEHSYDKLVSSLFLLSQCEMTLELIPILTHQLFYLSQGERSHKKETSCKCPQHSSEVTSELCKILSQLPISKEYSKSIIELAGNGDEFWVKVANREEMKALDISDFPKKLIEGMEEGSKCLSRFVFLRYLSEDVYLKSVMEVSRGLTETVVIPNLANFLSKVMIKCCPSLLFYDESCPHSQAVLYSLEEEMNTIIQSKNKSIICLSMGAGMEEKASELLLQPKSDFLLLKDVQFTSREWRNRLLWMIRKAQLSGCCIVLTTVMSLSCPSSEQAVSNELISACRTAHLSRMATNRTHHLPIQVWSFNSTCDTQKQHSFWALLVFNLANFPQLLMQKCNSLKEPLNKMVFRLFVVHTAMSMVNISGGELIPVHLSNIVASVMRLLSMVDGGIDENILVPSLVSFMRHIYSGCVTMYALEGVIQASVFAEPSDGHIQPLSEVQIEIFDQSIQPTSFLDTVIAGYKQCDFEKYRSCYSVRDAVDFVLLPTLSQATSSELYHQSRHHLPLPPGSCVQSTPAPCPEVVAMMTKWERQRRKCKCKALQETLETCLELLPHPLPLHHLDEISVDSGGGRELKTLSQLRCGDLLRKFVHIKRVHQFNSKVSQIQEDIQALMDYSIVGFDGLPECLRHVQASLEGEVMPKRWRGDGTSTALPVLLQEGFKMLLDYHISLLTAVTADAR